jgi:2-amino-4-hydroxy-6-hydroxymethyldihydropteridine diphosphokinase
MARVYLSLGSNVDPEQHLAAARTKLGDRFGPLDLSPTYVSRAVGFAGADFLNQVAAFECTLAHPALRAELRAMEDAAGRDRSLPRYADRTLDLDIALWCEGSACTSDLTREEFERAYVLAPLADLAPALLEPFSGQPLGARWRQLAPTLPAIRRR